MSDAKPALYPCRDEVFHGRGVWSMGEDGDMGVLVEGHGRRALAALSAYGRHVYGAGWRRHEGITSTPREIWVSIEETCGCTDEQHNDHVATAEGTEWAPDCDCEHLGLPPCRDDYGWVSVSASPGAPGAVAMTEADA